MESKAKDGASHPPRTGRPDLRSRPSHRIASSEPKMSDPVSAPRRASTFAPKLGMTWATATRPGEEYLATGNRAARRHGHGFRHSRPFRVREDYRCHARRVFTALNQ